MNGATQKFLSFLNTKLDGFGKVLSLDQMFQLQAAQRQIVDADVADFVVAKRNSSTSTASKEGWQYNKVGADLAEFVSDAVEFMLCVGLAYCVRTAEIRVKALWRTLPLSWQTQPVYDVLYKYKERSDENLRSNLEIAVRNAKINPAGFLDACLRTDSGAIERKKSEAAQRADAEAKLRQKESEHFQAKIDSEFAELQADTEYERKFAECVAWYKGKYPKSADFIDGCPQAVNGYLINMRDRGGYENFRHDDDQTTAEVEAVDYSILEDEPRDIF